LNDLAIASGAGKNDVKWNGKDSKTGKSSATVTVNGITRTIVVGENGTYISKDNRIVIDNEKFDKLFSNGSKGLSVNTTVSNGTIYSQTIKPGNSGSAPTVNNSSYPSNYKASNNVSNNTKPNVEIRVSNEKEFVQVSESWRKQHGGNYTTWDEAKAVFAVYEAGFRASDFKSYTDYEKAVYEAYEEIVDKKYSYTPEEFLMILLGVFAENNMKLKGNYAAMENGNIRYIEEMPKTRTLFRGERSSVDPDVAFEQGFKPKGTHNNLEQHVTSNTTAGDFISTTSEKGIAEQFAGKNGYVYEIETSNYIDVNKTLGAKSPFPEQMEFSVPGGVSSSQIKGAWVIKGGKLTGEFIPNPGFKEGK